MKKPYLITPGPTPIPPEVSAKEGLPILHHRTNEFQAFFAEVIAGLKYVYQTKNDVLLMSCSGSGAMESAVANILSPGEYGDCRHLRRLWRPMVQNSVKPTTQKS